MTWEEAQKAMQENVQRGAALLDAERPGWRESIHVKILRMDKCSSCVLGQLFGDYDWGLTKLIPPGEVHHTDWAAHHNWAVHHGFYAEYPSGVHQGPDETHLQVWDILKSLWVEEVHKRPTQYDQ